MAITLKTLGKALTGNIAGAVGDVAKSVLKPKAPAPAAAAPNKAPLSYTQAGIMGGSSTTHPGVPTVYQKVDDKFFGGLLPFGAPPGGFQRGVSCGSGSVAQMALAQAIFSGQMPVMTAPQQVLTERAPCGYVICTAPNGQKVAVLKELAYALGLRKRPTKRGGISSRDIQTARRVQGLLSSLTVARKPRMAIKRGGRRR